jgi:hypothetical protein
MSQQGVTEKTVDHPFIQSVKRIEMKYVDLSNCVRYEALLLDGRKILSEINPYVRPVITIDEWVEEAIEVVNKSFFSSKYENK